ncbi:MAG: hypothetical protein D3923_15085, partial [Candidatus Electrothrix sp. AR3]|nr:hypothetical protein [Candidatus Electrothrix sp. AR3]
RIPVYANSTAGAYPDDAAGQKALLAGQLVEPVRFREMIMAMYQDGITTFVEVGPGDILSTLVRDCLPEKSVQIIAVDHKKKSSHDCFWEAVAQLAVIGYDLNFLQLWKPFAVEDPTEPRPKLSAAAVKINGSNYGSPYPPKGGAAALPKPVSEQDVAERKAAARKPEPTSFRQSEPKPLSMSQEQTNKPSIASEPANNSLASLSADPSVLLAFQQTLYQAQMQFQQTLSQCHLEFLHTSTQALQALGGSPVDVRSVTSLPPIQPPPVQPCATTAAPVVPQSFTALSQINRMPEDAQTFQSLHSVPPSEPLPPPESVAVAPVSPVAEATEPEQNFQTVLLQVVADKTGYPEEMLELDLELEAGLGIDSIKRVEILSELQQRYPKLAEVDTERLAALQTLGEILELHNNGSGSVEVAIPVPLEVKP